MKKSRFIHRRTFLGATALAGWSSLILSCLNNSPAGPQSREVAIPADAPDRTVTFKQVPKDARWGGRLVYQQADEPSNLDPHVQEDPAAQFAAKPAYSGLLIPWENQAGVQEIQGDLVARWEQPGPTEYLFVLEPDVRWHNVTPVRGRKLTAADVVYNLERMRSNDPRIRTSALFEPIDKIEAVSETTVRARLKHPFAAFLSNLSVAWASIVPREMVETGQVEQRPVGTGPYVFESWDRDTGFRFRANSAYFVKGHPFADQLDILAVKDTAARERNLAEGEVDAGVIETVLKSASIVDQKRIEMEAAQPGMAFVESPGYSTTLKAYTNLTQAPFNDIRVRQALSFAIPYDQVVQLWAGQAARTGPVAPGNKTWSLPVTALPSFDPAKAKQLLSAAGFPEGFQTEMWVSSQYNGAEVAPLVQQLLRPYGIRIDVRTLDAARASSAIFRRSEPYPMTARADWSFDDPDRTLYDAFHSRGPSEHQGIGEAYPDSRTLDQLLERQRQELNNDVRRSIVSEIQRRLVDDAIQTWLVSPGSIIAIPPWVGNVHVMLGGPGTSYRLTGTVFIKAGPRSA